MSETQEDQKSFRYSLKQLMLAGLVVAVVVAAFLQYRSARRRGQLEAQLERLTAENQTLEYKLLLQRLATNLKIPTPALYHRYLPVRELHQMRVDALRAAGVEQCPPITALQRHDMDHADVSFLLSSNIYRIDNRPVSVETFWEGYAKIRGGNGASALSAYLRGTPGFREWLAGEHELRQEYLRPLLLRIAQAPDPRARYDAIEAMLLMGDRSTAVLRILRDSASRVADERDGLSELERLRFHDVDPARAEELISEFELESLIRQLR